MCCSIFIFWCSYVFPTLQPSANTYDFAKQSFNAFESLYKLLGSFLSCQKHPFLFICETISFMFMLKYYLFCDTSYVPYRQFTEIPEHFVQIA